MANDQPDDDDKNPARAFAELRAEVTILRRAVEGLPEVIHSIEAPDYGPSFGALVKAANATESRLAAIEGHPALRLTPEAHGHAMARVVAQSVAPAAEALRSESHDIGLERRALAEIVGRARTRSEQKRIQLWIAGAGVAAGFLLFPLLGIVVPGGSVLAALATGTADRWQAGVTLMQLGDPEGSRSIANTTRLMNANIDALRACSDAAKKTGKEQKCIIAVAAPAQ